jgi:hypothetical protein
MPINPDDPTLGALCAPAPPPAGVGDADCVDPTLNYGPIVNLYIFGQPFATTPTAAQIATLLAADPTTDPWGAGPLICQISKTPATGTPTRYNGRDIPAPVDLSYAVTIQDTKDANYEFARTTQKGGRSGYYYGVDKNGNWFGGQNGMTGGQGRLTLNSNLPTDENGLQTLTGTITGKGFFDDKRIVSPVPVLFG